MPKPGSPEWHARVNAMRAAEQLQPMRWWYLSFAEPGTFLGGAVVEARGPTIALELTHAMGINPGGEVQMSEIPAGKIDGIPEAMRNRLVSKEEWLALDKAAGL